MTFLIFQKLNFVTRTPEPLILLDFFVTYFFSILSHFTFFEPNLTVFGYFLYPNVYPNGYPCVILKFKNNPFNYIFLAHNGLIMFYIKISPKARPYIFLYNYTNRSGINITLYCLFYTITVFFCDIFENKNVTF